MGSYGNPLVLTSSCKNLVRTCKNGAGRSHRRFLPSQPGDNVCSMCLPPAHKSLIQLFLSTKNDRMNHPPRVLQQTLFSLTCLCAFSTSGCDLLGPSVDAAGIYVEELPNETTAYDFRSDGTALYYKKQRMGTGYLEFDGKGEWKARGKKVKYIGLVRNSQSC
jgi:hypothetical protein